MASSPTEMKNTRSVSQPMAANPNLQPLAGSQPHIIYSEMKFVN